MTTGSTFRGCRRCVCLFTMAFLLAFTMLAWAQTAAIAPDTGNAARDYVIAPGDLLSVRVMDAPESSGRFRVAESGFLRLPGLSSPIKAVGNTPLELSKAIADALKAAELMREPLVDVFVEEYRGRMVTVLGAVGRPSVYPLSKPTTLIEILSVAGGLASTAGKTLTIVRKEPLKDAGGSSDTDLPKSSLESTITVDLNKLLTGKDPSLNVEVHAGDVINASTAPVIYMAGAVTRPGGYAVQDRSEMTVLQGLALAGGPTPSAGASRSLIIRRSADGQERQLIPLDLNRLMQGKVGDQYLEANDIVFVPESSMRKSMRSMADLAKGTVGTLLVYGIGFRLIPR